MPVDGARTGAFYSASEVKAILAASRSRRYLRHVEVQTTERPRLPFLVERDRDLTALKFGDAARRAFELSGTAATTPEAFALAALEAVAASNEHNTHCRAGIPIDAAVQQTRRDLRTAIKALLEVEGLQFASSAALSAACERLTRFETDPNKDKLRGLRGLMYTQVSQWLAPHELEALAAASTTPGLRPETYERAESISARASLTSLRLALDVAQKAHLAAPQDAVLKTRYQHRLKQAFCAAELVFDSARQAFQQADQASREAHQSALALFTPESKTNWQISQYVRTLKKDALVQVAADLKKYASLRKLRLEPYCDSLPLGDETMAERRHDAYVQLAYVNAVADACDYLVRTLADRPRLPR